MSTRDLIQKLIPSHLVSKHMFDNSWTTTSSISTSTTSTTTTWIIIVIWYFLWLGPPQLFFISGWPVDDPFPARWWSTLIQYFVGLLDWARGLQALGPDAALRPAHIVAELLGCCGLGLVVMVLWGRRVGVVWCCCGGGSEGVLLIIILLN